MTFAYDCGSHYQIIITDGTPYGSFSYDYPKVQALEKSIQESERIVDLIIANRNFIPVPV